MRETKNVIVGVILFVFVLSLVMNIGRRNEKIMGKGVNKFDKTSAMRGTGKIRNGTDIKQDITTAGTAKRRTVQKTKQIQLALRKAGFNPGAIDGKIGPQTRKALLSFKRSQNLSNNDVLDEQTMTALQPHFKA